MQARSLLQSLVPLFMVANSAGMDYYFGTIHPRVPTSGPYSGIPVFKIANHTVSALPLGVADCWANVPLLGINAEHRHPNETIEALISMYRALQPGLRAEASAQVIFSTRDAGKVLLTVSPSVDTNDLKERLQ